MSQSMLRVAFWNTARKPISLVLKKIVKVYNLNVLVLLERGETIPTLLDALGEGASQPWFSTWGICSRVTVLTQFSDAFIRAEAEGERFSLRKIALPGLPDLILGAVHLRSRLHQTERSQVLATHELVRAVEGVEAALGHRRTLLVGDFNMDPFDDGMVGAGALHAMMTRRTALLGSRTIEKRSYQMFYNPMWSMLGDRESGPPGTYRYWSSEHVCREWHTFDQVLLRPTLIDSFPLERLRILKQVEEYSLLTKGGVPVPSDHLPVVFELNELGGENDER
jgi:hypothetical protein